MGKSTISMVIFNSYVKLPSCQLISCRTVFLSLVKPPGWLWPALRHFKSSTLNEEEIYVPQQILIFGVEFGVENVKRRFRSVGFWRDFWIEIGESNSKLR